MKKEKVAPSALLQASNGAVAQAVAKNSKAIGYIGFGYLNSSLKKINVNGIEATPATALSNTWPIARELYVFTNGQPSGAVKKLIDFLVDPQKGQKAVSEVGYIPLQK
jgi:phosphate transport system substrate-binding protein